jgi:hypothetical protein
MNEVKASVVTIYQREDGRWGWRETMRNNKQTTNGSEGDGFKTQKGAVQNFARHQERMARVAFRVVVKPIEGL